MSKMDAVRAMREARYAESQARAATTASPRRVTRASGGTAAAPLPPEADPVPGAAEETADDDRCGHRNMSGRTCTRERGHAAKTHRYA